jgi:integrase
MATLRITKRTVDAALPQAIDGYLWDDELSGFGLKITPAGAKTYLIQYRLGGRKGRTRRVTIGRHGVLTADQARIRAKILLGEVATGRDPADARDKAKGSSTFATAVESFLDQHVDAKLKASTSEEYHRLVRLYLPKNLRSRPLAEIKRADIVPLHLSLRHKPFQANRLMAMLSKFFNWAEQHGLRPDGTNPCRHIEKYRERKRERFLADEEFERLGRALADAERDIVTTPWVTAAIRLLILTGARLSEIRTLRWSEVDFEHQMLRLGDSKTGGKTIQLSDAALEVLARIPRVQDNPYVSCGDKPGACIVNLQKPWRRIRSMGGLDDVRIHDLRHSFASVAAAQGLSLPVIGALLGHSQPATTARYAHLAQDPLAKANAEISGRIAATMNGKRPCDPPNNGGRLQFVPRFVAPSRLIR